MTPEPLAAARLAGRRGHRPDPHQPDRASAAGQPHARITERDRDEQGRALVNDDGTDLRLRDPYTVPVVTVPPGVRRTAPTGE